MNRPISVIMIGPTLGVGASQITLTLIVVQTLGVGQKGRGTKKNEKKRSCKNS